MRLLVELEMDTPGEEARDMSVGDRGRPAMDPAEAVDCIMLAISELKKGNAPKAALLLADIAWVEIEITEVLED